MSVETPVAPEADKKTRVKRSPAELKAARVEKARKALERTRDSGTKVVERAATATAKAKKAQAAADAHAEALELAERNLAWEQARPVPGESLTGEADDPFVDGEDVEDGDTVDDFDDDDTDVDDDDL